jgi:hypothetical protein
MNSQRKMPHTADQVKKRRWQIYSKPLTPELNPSAQRCLPKFFIGDFNF